MTGHGGEKNPAGVKSKVARIRDWEFTRIVDEIWFSEQNGGQFSAQRVGLKDSFGKERKDSNYTHDQILGELLFDTLRFAGVEIARKNDAVSINWTMEVPAFLITFLDQLWY